MVSGQQGVARRFLWTPSRLRLVPFTLSINQQTIVKLVYIMIYDIMIIGCLRVVVYFIALNLYSWSSLVPWFTLQVINSYYLLFCRVYQKSQQDHNQSLSTMQTRQGHREGVICEVLFICLFTLVGDLLTKFTPNRSKQRFIIRVVLFHLCKYIKGCMCVCVCVQQDLIGKFQLSLLRGKCVCVCLL